MNTEATLQVEMRSDTGKWAARRLRREGRIPGNLYGRGIDAQPVWVDERELEALVGRISVDNTLVDLGVGSEGSRKVLIREIQRHPVRSSILHVDFFQIRADEKLRVSVPLHLTGTPAGVKEGGVLQQNRHELEVECLPDEIPERFEIDVSGLEIGDSLHVADVPTGGVTPLEDPGLTVCTVQPPRMIEEEEEEEDLLLGLEEELEPEVITARGEEEEEEEEGEDEE